MRNLYRSAHNSMPLLTHLKGGATTVRRLAKASTRTPTRGGCLIFPFPYITLPSSLGLAFLPAALPPEAGTDASPGQHSPRRPRRMLSWGGVRPWRKGIPPRQTRPGKTSPSVAPGFRPPRNSNPEIFSVLPLLCLPFISRPPPVFPALRPLSFPP